MMTPEEIAEIRRDGWHGLAPDQIDRLCDELDARNGEIRCLKARIAALESQVRTTAVVAPALAVDAMSSDRAWMPLSELNRVYGDES